MIKLRITSAYSEAQIEELEFHTAQQAEQALAKAFALYKNKDIWLPAYQRIAVLEKLW